MQNQAGTWMKCDINSGETDKLDITGREDKSEQWEKKNRWWEERVGESRGGRIFVGQILPKMQINLPLNYYH